METWIYIIISIVAGLAAGCVLMKLFAARKETQLGVACAKAEAQAGHLAEQLAAAQERLAKDLAAQKADFEERLDDLTKNYEGRLDGLAKDYEKRLAEQKKTFDEEKDLLRQDHAMDLRRQGDAFKETAEKLKAEVKSATEDILRQRQEEFAASSKSSLDGLVNPLKASIEGMKAVFEENKEKQTEIKTVIEDHMKAIAAKSEAAKESADRLTQAMRHNSKVQGDWGEMILKDLLESMNLSDGVQFDTQPTLRDAKGRVIRNDNEARMRPDVILHMGDNRELIIDAKVSLSAYMDYANATNDEQREMALQLHIKSLRDHVKELSRKDYAAYIQPPKSTMDFVIMFVPNTGALWLALKREPKLWHQAMKENVYIADEQTLSAVLRVIDLTWRQIARQKNYEEVFRLANEMVKRVEAFQTQYDKIGEQLSKLHGVYEDGAKKLAPTGRSIITTANQIKGLEGKVVAPAKLPETTSASEEFTELKPIQDT